jgi:dihydrofolate reductase
MIPIRRLKRRWRFRKEQMKIVAIAAVGKNGVIAKGQDLPWEIPEDMKFFRDTTRDQIVVMGRKTFQALGKAMPKRENAVLTRDANFSAPDIKVFSQIETAIEYYRADAKWNGKILFIIGGAEIYRLAIPYLDEVWLTEIDAEFDGDVFYPHYHAGRFELPGFSSIERKPQQDQASPYRYFFVKYARK